VQVLDGWDGAGLKAIASAMTAGPDVVVALLSSTPAASLVIARSSDVTLDANALLRKVVEQFAGRGGGKLDLAQGGFVGKAEEVAQTVRALLEQAVRDSPGP
jgi:alanyl-tRNA synthetase